MVITFRFIYFFYFLINLSVIIADDDNDLVVPLTPSNFKAALQESNFSFVEFYAPWCGHCQQFKPTWDLFAKEIKERTKNNTITIAKVDCDAHRGFCLSHSIKGFPTLKLFTKDDPDNAVFYEKGQRTITNLIDFLVQNNITIQEKTEPFYVKMKIRRVSNSTFLKKREERIIETIHEQDFETNSPEIKKTLIKSISSKQEFTNIIKGNEWTLTIFYTNWSWKWKYYNNLFNFISEHFSNIKSQNEVDNNNENQNNFISIISVNCDNLQSLCQTFNFSRTFSIALFNSEENIKERYFGNVNITHIFSFLEEFTKATVPIHPLEVTPNQITNVIGKMLPWWKEFSENDNQFISSEIFKQKIHNLEKDSITIFTLFSHKRKTQFDNRKIVGIMKNI